MRRFSFRNTKDTPSDAKKFECKIRRGWTCFETRKGNIKKIFENISNYYITKI